MGRSLITRKAGRPERIDPSLIPSIAGVTTEEATTIAEQVRDASMPTVRMIASQAAAPAAQAGSAAMTEAKKPTPRLDALEAWRVEVAGTLSQLTSQLVTATSIAVTAQRSVDDLIAKLPPGLPKK